MLISSRSKEAFERVCKLKSDSQHQPRHQGTFSAQQPKTESYLGNT